MDQTSVKLQNTYKKTLSPVGVKQVRVIQPPGDPDCLTVTLTVCADGTKFSATIIFKGNKETGRVSPRILNKLVVPENIKVYSNASGWWNSDFDRFWLAETFENCSPGSVLIRDRAPAHSKIESDFLLNEMGIRQVFIPAGLTGTYQPLDVGVNFPFKSYLKLSYHDWRDSHTEVTKSGYLRKPNRQDFIDFVSGAWEKVKVTTVENSFVGAQIVPEPLYMIANPEEASEVDNLDDTFDCSFSSVEDSFTEA
ncbi:hypothetical protein RvY_17156 [Ramazzottius varieornatus]|uniref:DDE-1 domain-containing protein n=1 Tax=Ramazzottius varieornatus TaxID=947166 RepID=A0A1D1W3H6_RAMVA|nr:hypothetical protein RvY_17156 [Ramazzottius varieornatus]